MGTKNRVFLALLTGTAIIGLLFTACQQAPPPPEISSVAPVPETKQIPIPPTPSTSPNHPNASHKNCLTLAFLRKTANNPG